MPDRSKKFNEFSLKSILFIGRHDWYFCYLKSERIAHVLALLAQTAPEHGLDALSERAAGLPGEICRLAAGEFDAPVVLADIFGLLSGIRLATTAGLIHKENAALLCAEYEQVAERLVAGSHPSPFAPGDFAVPHFGLIEAPGHRPLPAQKDIQDIKDKREDKGHSERSERIIEVLKRQKTASIKALVSVITDCSEKTIQRELASLVARGLVRKTGERRWSVYSLAG